MIENDIVEVVLDRGKIVTAEIDTEICDVTELR